MASADPDPGPSADDSNSNSNSNSDSDTADHSPVTPHATPILDAAGRLTYVGDDGRRYVVGFPEDADEQAVERVMQALRRGGVLFQEIEALCRRWLTAVSGEDLDPRSALALLLTTLETALEEGDDAASGPEGLQGDGPC